MTLPVPQRRAGRLRVWMFSVVLVGTVLVMWWWRSQPPSTLLVSERDIPAQVSVADEHVTPKPEAASAPPPPSAYVLAMSRSAQRAAEERGKAAPTVFDERPLLQRVDDAQKRAEAGDAEAAAQLGDLLRNCLAQLREHSAASIHDVADDAIEDTGVDRSDRKDVMAASETGNAIDPAPVLTRHAGCVAVGQERVDEYHLWLERAARAGSVNAMRSYFLHALDGFDGNRALIADLDEVIRRRDLARSFGLQAVAAGDINILPGMGYAYSPNGYGVSGIFPPDQVMARAYQYVAELADAAFRSEQTGRFEFLWRKGPGSVRKEDLDSAQWQASIHAGRQIFLRNYTSPAPGGG